MDLKIILKKRVINIECSGLCNPWIFKKFIEVFKEFREPLSELMDRCRIPSHLIIVLRKGKGDIFGMYYPHEKHISKNIVIIDIYTLPFEKLMQDQNFPLKRELLDTIVHEIIHHKFKSEILTNKKTRKFMQRLEKNN